MPRRRQFRRTSSPARVQRGRNVGWNSHGEISTLASIKRLELDRGNEWFDDAGLDLDRTRAVWVAYEPRVAVRYSHYAEFWDHDPKGRNPTHLEDEAWEEYKRQMRYPTQYVRQVDLTGSVKVLEDGDDGYLHIWPVHK